jgi:hypothetical protein
LQRHSKSRPTHHRSGKDRKLSNATLGEKSTQPSPCEATRQEERARRPAPHELRETRTSWCAQDKDRNTVRPLPDRVAPTRLRRSASPRRVKERPHHPKRIVAFAATHPDFRAATVAPHGTPAFEYQSGPETRAVRPTRRHRSAPPEAGRAARGKATRSESDRRVPASGGAKKIRSAISAPQGRLHPVAILFAPKKKSRRRSASRPKRDAPPGAGQGVDGLSRSVSNRQRPSGIRRTGFHPAHHHGGATRPPRTRGEATARQSAPTHAQEQVHADHQSLKPIQAQGASQPRPRI